MPGASGSGSGAGASASAAPAPATAGEGPGEPQSEIRFSVDYKCAICALKFENSREQRDHMRGEWHIHNLRRRVDGLESVDEETYTLKMEVAAAMKKKSSSGSTTTTGGTNYVNRRNHVLPREGTFGESSISAGRQRHQQQQSRTGFSSEEQSSEDDDDDEEDDEDDDDEEEIEYESDWRTASSSDSDSDSSEDSQDPNQVLGRRIDGDELRLPSGKILGNKDSQRRKRVQLHTQEAQQTEEPGPDQPSSSRQQHHHQHQHHHQLLHRPRRRSNSNPYSSSSRPQSEVQTLAKRNLAGLLGLSPAERTALFKTERKTLSAEVRKQRAYQDGVDRIGNSQKHYRIGGSRGGKKMGGLEKRLG